MEDSMVELLLHEEFNNLIIHLILPPDCPQRQDANVAGINILLLQQVQKSMLLFTEQCADEVKSGWQSVERMMTQWVEVQKKHSIHPDKLEEALLALPVNSGIALYIRAQNSGILMHRLNAEHIQFEFFEAAPHNIDMAVAGSSDLPPGRLVRNFPGSMIICPWSLVLDQSFRYEFCNIVSKLHEEKVHEFQNSMGPTPKPGFLPKADPLDSEHPGMVTDFLANILAPHGQVLPGGTITKRTREECLYNGSGHPWRRTPIWIVIRVAIQRALSHVFGSEKSRIHYKNFLLYFCSQIEEEAKKQGLPLGLQHLLSVKIARRVAKLGSDGFSFVTMASTSAAKAMHQVVQTTWNTVQEVEKMGSQIAVLENRVAEHQATFPLSNSRNHIMKAMSTRQTSSFHTWYPPKAPKRLWTGIYGLPQLSPTSIHREPWQLADFEFWIADEVGFQDWLEKAEDSEQKCNSLHNLMDNYLSTMMDSYAACPERYSIGFLTVLEIWVALDKVQCIINPSLADYSPGIPTRIMEPFLLRKRDHIARLSAIEDHLAIRNGSSTEELSDVFRNLEKYFVEFFNQSKNHQKILQQIEDEIAAQVEGFRADWQDAKEKYDGLMQDAKDLPHDSTIKDNKEDHIETECRKCRMISKAAAIKIPIYERPLPDSPEHQKVIVVELNLPPGFRAWRDATWRIIQDLARTTVIQREEKTTGKMSAAKKEDTMYITGYGPLSGYRYGTRGDARVTLCASTKPRYLKGHSSKKMPIAMEDVCVANPSVWAFFDKKNAAWIACQKQPPTFHRYLVYELPEGPYRHLQSVMTSTDYTDNSILAKQSECLLGLSLKEHYCFGALRAGRRLQLKNILRAMAAQTLNLKTLAVQTLIQQTVWEVGPRHDPGSDVAPKDYCLRVGHADLDSKSYCRELLSTLDDAVLQSASSWSDENMNALFSAVVLNLRVLSFATSDGIRTRARYDLRNMRDHFRRFLECLSNQTTSPSRHETESAKRVLLFKAANLFKMTFDVDRSHISSVFHSDQDVEDFATALLLAHENSPLGDLQPHIKETIFRGYEISVTLEKAFRDHVPISSTAITSAIVSRCDILAFEEDWQFCPGNSNPWIENRTSNADPITVHFNILSGELLVQGRQVQRIPDEIARDSLYQSLFKDQAVPVIPSTIPDMQYTAAKDIFGHKVHFRQTENRLVIRADVKERKLEALPSSIFLGDLPAWFVSDFVHFLDLNSGTIEFRPKDNPWRPSSESAWSLRFDAVDGSRMASSLLQLVPSHHMLCQKIQSILGHLETPEHILVFLNERHDIQIELRRYTLKFSISKNGELISEDYDAIVDQKQDIGCLYGLRDKLVLLDRTRTRLAQRHVLIPFGPVRVVKHQDHVVVKIDHKAQTRVQHFRYRCDDYLKVIQSQGEDRLSNFFLIYLHALTAFMLPDPLTNQTGTARALFLLREPILRSTRPLHAEELEMLKCIACLTPERHYKPDKKHELQNVLWMKNLSAFSQHEDFYIAAKQIKDLSDNFAALYNKESDLQEFVVRDNPELGERAKAHSAWFRAPVVLDQKHEVQDLQYHARDAYRSLRGDSVFQTADLLRRWPSDLRVSDDVFGEMLSMDHVDGFGLDYAPKSLDETQRVSLGIIWGSLFETCRSEGPESKWKLTFLLGQISYKAPGIFEEIQTLIAIACSGRFRDFDPPGCRSYTTACGLHPNVDDISIAIRAHAMSFNPNRSNSSKKTPRKRAVKKQTEQAAITQHNRQIDEQVRKLRDHLASQWPTMTPTAPPATETFPSLIVQKAVNSVAELFHKIHHNLELGAWFQHLQESLNELPAPEDDSDIPPWPERQPLAKSTSRRICTDLFGMLEAAEPPTFKRLQPGLTFEFDTVAPNTNNLEVMLRSQTMKDNLSEAFGCSLLKSVQAYKQFRMPLEPDPRALTPSDLKDHLTAMKTQFDGAFLDLGTVLFSQSDAEGLLSSTAVLAPVTPYSLLAMLARPTRETLPPVWRKVLADFGTRLALYQRAERLVRASRSELLQELQCAGQIGWNAETRPDWLLLEIENNLTIRSEQVEIANEMISPKSECNSIYQLAMGGGKSSVIIPMVATAIADGTTLARILTLKSLLSQSYGLLSQRLGRLINRPVYHLPFSRSTPFTLQNVELVDEFYKKLTQTCGALVALPEEVLSFQLSAREKMRSSPTLAFELVNVVDQLCATTRDIIDESDEVLDLKSQLVFTMGNQQQMEAHPKRWLLTMEILGRMANHARTFERDSNLSEAAVRNAGSPHVRNAPSLEVIERGLGSFPFIRFLQDGASRHLIAMIIDDVKSERIPGFSFNYLSPNLKTMILRFIRDRGVDKETSVRVEIALRHAPHIWHGALLLRGLLALGILQFALEQKRFGVDYGLHLERTLTAVPYRAKGIPHPSAEFAQPEIAIILTVLGYYYTGLTNKQVRQAFAILFEESDASDEYSNWIKIPAKGNFPQHLLPLRNVNLDDNSLCEELFSCVRHSQRLLDFYLKKVVFPRHATEYTKRLATSAWDIPSSNPQRLTVGFSGTNDNRSLLPLSIKQHDLHLQKHTNAMIMDLLLLEENKACINGVDAFGSALSTHGLIQHISDCESSPSVIIDVGAQILDLSNREVVTKWLDMKPNARAAIYYDKNDDPQVVDRTGSTCRLAASPLRDRMGNTTLVFLDQAHSRGVDLKIPIGAKAAVILGPRLCRDRLMQACMRMRKLGTGHSLIFVAPPDVHRSIINCVNSSSTIVTSADILQWSIAQTCAQLKKNASHWISQGAEFVQRERDLKHYIENGNIDKMMAANDPMIIEFMESIEQPESRNLDQLYGYRESSESSISLKLKDIQGQASAAELLEKWRQIDPAQFEQLALGEEQEREVSVEVQQKESVEHPLTVQARKPVVRGEVRYFVENGSVNTSRFRGTKDLSTLDIYPVSVMLSRTSAVSKDTTVWEPEDLHVTREFVESVDIPKTANIDPYLRPIQWVLTSTTSNDILIVSPFEADELHDIITQSSKVRLHLYAPKVNNASRDLSNLDFLIVSGEEHRIRLPPPSQEAIRDINLLAGSTYLNSFDKYEALLGHLGILRSMRDNYHQPGWQIGGDGFVDVQARRIMNWTYDCPFKRSPIPFFQAWYSMRMKGQDFANTHIGRITDSKPLTEEDFGVEKGLKQEFKQEDSLFVREESAMRDANVVSGGSTSFGNGDADVDADSDAKDIE